MRTTKAVSFDESDHDSDDGQLPRRRRRIGSVRLGVVSDDAPDNEAMRLYELRVVMYLNEEGEPFTSFRWIGEAAGYIESLGMLEATKLSIEYNATHPDDEDDDGS
jgi:hypothetical protein